MLNEALQTILELSEDCADLAYYGIWDPERRKKAVMMMGHISTLAEVIMDESEPDERQPQFREYVYRKFSKKIREYCHCGIK